MVQIPLRDEIVLAENLLDFFEGFGHLLFRVSSSMCRNLSLRCGWFFTAASSSTQSIKNHISYETIISLHYRHFETLLNLIIPSMTINLLPFKIAEQPSRGNLVK